MMYSLQCITNVQYKQIYLINNQVYLVLEKVTE